MTGFSDHRNDISAATEGQTSLDQQNNRRHFRQQNTPVLYVNVATDEPANAYDPQPVTLTPKGGQHREVGACGAAGTITESTPGESNPV